MRNTFYNHLFLGLTSLGLMFTGAQAWAKIKVVTSTPDLAAVVEAVGQDQVDVTSIARGTQDPHQIDAKPSFMVKMRDADLVVEQGLELEDAWMIPLINGSRNPKIQTGGHGILSLGDKIDPIEVPQGNVSRAEGDVHPGGNPHFTLDPIRMGKSAVIIGDKLAEMDPAHSAAYVANAKAYQKHLEDRTKDWQARLAKTGIKEVVSYHKTFAYFLERFGIICNIQLEPRPGIPPTASHILQVIDEIKARHIRLVLIENLYDDHSEEKLKNAVPGLTVSRVPVYVGGDPAIKTTEQLVENLVKVFEAVPK